MLQFLLCFQTQKKLFRFINILVLDMCKWFRALGLNEQRVCEVHIRRVSILQQENRCADSGNVIHVSTSARNTFVFG